VFGVVGVEIDTADVHWCVGRWGGDNDFLSTSLQVSGSLVDGGKDTLKAVAKK
jgi:hypothetical protein